jgi:hypothetical protein
MKIKTEVQKILAEYVAVKSARNSWQTFHKKWSRTLPRGVAIPIDERVAFAEVELVLRRRLTQIENGLELKV